MWYSETTTTTNGDDSRENKRLRQEIKRLDARIDWLVGRSRNVRDIVFLWLGTLTFGMALLAVILKGLGL